MNSGTDAGRPGLGRRIMLWVGAIVVVLSAGIGWLVGSNGSIEISEAAILGTGVTIPVTPAAVALYGVAVSVLLLGVLFGLVELASRLEGENAGSEPRP
ncbi:DUF7520 family protein [Halobellus rufus]|uniref:DUF7520 family protein n=1 Tax=Halobellus rufus TaxID=1448860 RepID=UPI000678D1F3|nr:hypothetical protein [Halobellus rufus]